MLALRVGETELVYTTDIPADESPTGFSMPGEVLWWREFQPGAFDATIYADAIREGWMDPPDGFQPPPADTVCWRYQFFIDAVDAFYQQGSADNPVVYWLDVKALPLSGDQAIFGWKTSQFHWNDDAVWARGFEPWPGPWNELIYPPGHQLGGLGRRRGADVGNEIGDGKIGFMADR